MKKDSWISELNKVGYIYKPEQYDYAYRTSEFINSQHKIQVNQGGMGLGKTYAICKIIKDNLFSFDSFFIATPTASIKTEWANEFNKLDLRKKYMVWLAKSDILKRYHRKISDCDDDCLHRSHLECWNKEYRLREYTPLCYELLDSLNFPLDIEEYYDKSEKNKQNEPSNCLLPIIRLGLREREIAVGDYFGFINKKVYYHLTNKSPVSSLLIIDEAHLVPERVKSLLSNQIRLLNTLKAIKKEIEEIGSGSNLFVNEPMAYYALQKSIISIERVYDKLKSICDLKEIKEGRYTYNQFVEDYNSLRQHAETFDINELINYLVKLAEQIDKNDLEDETAKSRKFAKFLIEWQEKQEDITYSQHFQYFNYKKNNKECEIILKIVCSNPANYLTNVWNNWNKIILLSGTIPEKKYFSDMLGLNNFDTIYESPIDSYNIRENVLIYPIGDFKSSGGTREKTLEEQKDSLQNVLSELKGRTIIYVLSKDMSKKIEEQCKNKNIINFCKNEDGEEINKNEFDRLKKEFSDIDEGIAIINITGRVEGQNFVNEEGDSVDNIIIYGYPFIKRGLEYDDLVEYWTHRLKNSQSAKEYVEFRPNASRIYQACMRAKRSKKDNPIIILWGSTYSRGSPGYAHNYPELKGELVYDLETLLNQIKKRNNDRKKEEKDK